MQCIIKKNNISYANANANGVVEELCGIWTQKYFISPKTQH